MLARPVSTASAGSAGVEETLPTNRVSSERQRTMSVKVPPISTPIRTPGDAVVIGGLSCQRRSRAALWLLRLGRRPVSSCRPPVLAAAPLSSPGQACASLRELGRAPRRDRVWQYV